MSNKVTKPNECIAYSSCQDSTNERQKFSKEEWIRSHTERILKSWLQWETQLGVAPNYARHIANELSVLYEHPLKRAFVESTY